MKHIELNCSNCGKKFNRNIYEHRSCIKKGYSNHFCSRSCACSYGNKLYPSKGSGNLIPGSSPDEYTQFRFFIKVARYRSKLKSRDMDIDLPFLKRLWENQGGKCALCGVPLNLPLNSDRFGTKNPYNASLDRIDNSKGYIKDNVRFIAHIASIARGEYSDQEVIHFCKNVINLSNEDKSVERKNLPEKTQMYFIKFLKSTTDRSSWGQKEFEYIDDMNGNIKIVMWNHKDINFQFAIIDNIVHVKFNGISRKRDGFCKLFIDSLRDKDRFLKCVA